VEDQQSQILFLLVGLGSSPLSRFLFLLSFALSFLLRFSGLIPPTSSNSFFSPFFFTRDVIFHFWRAFFFGHLFPSAALQSELPELSF